MGAVGALVVIICVFGGYAFHGGHLLVLWQPIEIVIIGGAALGGFIIANPMAIIKLSVGMVVKAWFGKGPGKQAYIELTQLLFQLFSLFRKEGPQAVEKHIEEPEKSDIFKNYPTFIKNHHAVDFLCDTMKVTLTADLSQYDIEDLLNDDIKTIHEEEHAAMHAIQNIAEALPGLGIVAAVLGVVHTMGILDQGTEVIGRSIAAALVGTFLGVLACYGFVAPTASKMARDMDAEGQYLKTIKAGLVALQRGNPPAVCVEYVRRLIAPAERPTFKEVDTATKSVKKAA